MPRRSTTRDLTPDERLRARMRCRLLKLAGERNGSQTLNALGRMTPAQLRAWEEAIEWADRWRLVRFGLPHFRLRPLGRLARLVLR